MPIDIDAIRKRAEAATPGPWECHSDGLVWANRLGDPVSGSTELEDAEFIAHARQDVPALLAALTDARDDNDRLRAGIKAIADRWAAPPAPIRVAPYEAELFVEDLCNLLDAGGAA